MTDIYFLLQNILVRKRRIILDFVFRVDTTKYFEYETGVPGQKAARSNDGVIHAP